MGTVGLPAPPTAAGWWGLHSHPTQYSYYYLHTPYSYCVHYQISVLRTGLPTWGARSIYLATSTEQYYYLSRIHGNSSCNPRQQPPTDVLHL